MIYAQLIDFVKEGEISFLDSKHNTFMESLIKLIHTFIVKDIFTTEEISKLHTLLEEFIKFSYTFLTNKKIESEHSEKVNSSHG